MNENVKDDLQHIRKMMEQSSRFISLSGLSGVIAGIIALLGAGAAYFIYDADGSNYFDGRPEIYNPEMILKLFVLAIIVLVAAVGAGIFFTVRKSRRKGLKIWTSTTRHLLMALGVPLIAGGLFCVASLYQYYFIIIAPATLVFYGLALVNAAKYTYSDIQNLGYCEILLGIIVLFLPGYGLLFWAVGFGLLHIIYGLVMYRKYE
ncbi:hypothetical protein [Niabella ginsengisoli]|uniref:DUF973 family protein n=1 Tax=Niabella ginsengisoli TaxID=522298 RepID=A0ABS9SQK9_9BACT|nr:hypothetical protein [Niabella ginsengisoli]MCH5600660.1 hypothetical protein [Niabella ginsengisoli]